MNKYVVLINSGDIEHYIRMLREVIDVLEELDPEKKNQSLQYLITELKDLLEILQSDAGLWNILTLLISKLISYLKL